MKDATTISAIPADTHLLTINEVASILRCDPTTCRRWAKQGVLKVVVLPHANNRQAYRVKRETLNEILATKA